MAHLRRTLIATLIQWIPLARADGVAYRHGLCRHTAELSQRGE